MIMYIICEMGFEYDDNYNYEGEHNIANTKYAFLDKDLAIKQLNKLNLEEFYQSYLINDVYDFREDLKLNDEIKTLIPNIEKLIKNYKKETHRPIKAYFEDYFEDKKINDLSDKDFKIVECLFDNFDHEFFCLTEAEVCDTFA